MSEEGNNFMISHRDQQHLSSKFNHRLSISDLNSKVNRQCRQWPKAIIYSKKMTILACVLNFSINELHFIA